MKNWVHLSILFVLMITVIPGQAQKTNAERYKPPRLFTKWGNGIDSAKMTVDEAKKLIPLSLAISDAAGNKYDISSYNFVYKRVAYIEDEKTGKPIPSSTMVSSLFRNSPLPPIWIKQVSEELKPGEELFFFDVYVKDGKGRILTAPNLRILVR